MNTWPYDYLVPTGDSSPYFGTYVGQRYGWFDTNSCWDFAACEVAETRLETLWKFNRLPQDTKDWLIANRYIDTDGDVFLSRRWVTILSGVTDNGNDEANFWRIASTVGLIPDWMLPYDPTTASKWITKAQFNNDYFNQNLITPEMRTMGQEFLKRFSIKCEDIGSRFKKKDLTLLKTCLKEGSVQIGIPVPQDGSWNQELVQYNGRTMADHSVELYKMDDSTYPYYIYDSYEPHLKRLSSDYFIPIATRVGILPIIPMPTVPVVQKKGVWQQVWEAVWSWFSYAQ